ncbi:alpha/beta family hydrolase [Pseudonocardia ailaonensis]|uniref:alpha/beta hydrolase family protein n=1 Tax=Pseudonocardia ailaonensis TaxID=367279 RepID=UPI0031D56E5C
MGESREIGTPHGPARVHLHLVEHARGALVLGHGAGGGVEAPDLKAATRAAREAGLHVVLSEQPYRVAGRRAPAPAGQLDTAWLAVVAALREAELAGLPLFFGGRSSGARVACRCAGEGEAAGVVCLAFPEHPPGRPEKHRRAEIDGVAVPVLVIQGDRDPFGCPPPAPGCEVVVLPGDHSLKKDLPAVERSVGEWLARQLP